MEYEPFDCCGWSNCFQELDQEKARLRGNNYDILILVNGLSGEETSIRVKPGTLELSDYVDGDSSSPSRFET